MPSPVAEYLLREGSGTIAHDTSGNGHDGTLSSGAHTPVWVSNGLLFDGNKASNVLLPDATLAFDNTSITAASIEAWAALLPGRNLSMSAPLPGAIVTLDGADFVLFWADDGTNGPHLSQGLFSGDVWSFTGSFEHQGEVFSSLPADGIFRHVVVVYDGTNIKIYYDGQLQGTIAAAFPGTAIALGTSPGEKFIGGDGTFTPGVASIAGIVGEVRLWNVALTATEVLNQYNSTKSRYPGQTTVNVSTIDWPDFCFEPEMSCDNTNFARIGQKRIFKAPNGALYKMAYQQPGNTNPALEVYKSTDGLNWTIMDSAHAPAILFANAIAKDMQGTSFYVLYTHWSGISVATGMRVAHFDTSTDQWIGETADLVTPNIGTYPQGPNTFGLHVPAAGVYDIVYVDWTAQGLGGVPQIYQARYSGGSWSGSTQICTDITNATITGFFPDPANNQAVFTYSAWVQTGNTIPTPNPVKLRTISSSGTLSAANQISSDVQPANALNHTYPIFGVGDATASGKIFLPYPVNSNTPISNTNYPAVYVYSGSSWTSTQLGGSPSNDFLQSSTDAGGTACIIDQSGTVWVLWSSNNGPTSPFFVAGQINYSTSTNSGVSWSGWTTLYDPVTEPPPYVDQSNVFGNMCPVPFNNGMGVLVEALNSMGAYGSDCFYTPILAVTNRAYIGKKLTTGVPFVV